MYESRHTCIPLCLVELSFSGGRIHYNEAKEKQILEVII